MPKTKTKTNAAYDRVFLRLSKAQEKPKKAKKPRAVETIAPLGVDWAKKLRDILEKER